jgi:Zn ribbon nucleic-acid-binding protein
MKTSFPTCPKCRCADFQLRIIRDEAVAAAQCISCSADYLLLDSKDYWFDIIQKGYPRLTRCSCKSESFRLRIDYSIRDDGEVDFIEVHSICIACGKTRRRLDFEVDYVGTDHLLKRPLVPCKNPKVLYDLRNLNLLLELSDMLRIMDHLGEEGCRFLCRMRREDKWVPEWQDVSQAKETIEMGRYLCIYAVTGEIEVSEDQLSTAKKEDAFWKRSDVVRISPKRHVCLTQYEGKPSGMCYSSSPQTHPNYIEVGLSFYIDFSNEFVRGETVVRKSEGFRKITASLLSLLKEQFVSWRSPHSFDNPDVNVRAFGDRFVKKRGVK